MRKVFGGLLVAIGVLLAGTTGLCTGYAILVLLRGLINNKGAPQNLSLLLIGIIPCGIGVLIAILGLAMMRSVDRD